MLIKIKINLIKLKYAQEFQVLLNMVIETFYF